MLTLISGSIKYILQLKYLSISTEILKKYLFMIYSVQLGLKADLGIIMYYA
jgi:hypothetical protein